MPSPLKIKTLLKQFQNKQLQSWRKKAHFNQEAGFLLL